MNSTSRSISSSAPGNLPLAGVRVLEMGQLIAGPFGGQLLGYAIPVTNENLLNFGVVPYSQFGAEVIKIEPPGIGDPLRVWRELDVDGTSPWFRSIGRNKKSVAIDLRKPEGRKCVQIDPRVHTMLTNSLTISLARQLAIKSDVILENFKPGSQSF